MLAELSDGTLYYNSRRHWAEEGANPRRRWTATSTDGGHTETLPSAKCCPTVHRTPTTAAWPASRAWP